MEAQVCRSSILKLSIVILLYTKYIISALYSLRFKVPLSRAAAYCTGICPQVLPINTPLIGLDSQNGNLVAKKHHYLTRYHWSGPLFDNKLSINFLVKTQRYKFKTFKTNAYHTFTIKASIMHIYHSP